MANNGLTTTSATDAMRTFIARSMCFLRRRGSSAWLSASDGTVVSRVTGIGRSRSTLSAGGASRTLVVGRVNCHVDRGDACRQAKQPADHRESGLFPDDDLVAATQAELVHS